MKPLKFLLQLAAFSKASAVMFGGLKKDQAKLKSNFDKILNDENELGQLSASCVDSQKEFQMRYMSKYGGSDAAAGNKEIMFAPHYKSYHPTQQLGIMTHETMHSSLGIINNNEAKKYPYSNDEEKKLYKNVLDDLNKNLKHLTKELIRKLKNPDHKISPRFQSVIDTLSQRVITYNIPIANKDSFKKGSFITLALSPCEGQPPMESTQQDEAFEFPPSGSVVVPMKYKNPIANTLAVISRYQEEVELVPSNKKDVEQPAYASQHLGSVMSQISTPMHNFMTERLRSCNPENKPQKPSASAAIKKQEQAREL